MTQSFTFSAQDALVVVDMQVDFVEPGRPGAVSGAPDCVAPIAAAAQAVRDAGGTVAWIRREYAADGSDVERSRLLSWQRAPFCVAGTDGIALIDGLVVQPGDIELVKSRWSAFFATDLAARLRQRRAQRVVIAGVDLARCVRATVMDAISHDFDVAVLAAGTSTRSPAALEANFSDLADIGVPVLD
jgi:nicotinamidase-related amidase